MTVPYTDEPTGREQRSEKRTVVMKTLPGNDDRTPREADSANESKDEANLPCENATGVNGTEEIGNPGKSTVLNETDNEEEASVKSDVQIELEAADVPSEELSEKDRTNGSSDSTYESIRDRDIRIVTEKYAINFEYGVPVKPVESETSAFPEGTCTEETPQTHSASARGADDSSNDVSRMQLHDLRYSLENIITGEVREPLGDDQEDRAGSSDASEAGKVLGETYDPESELNFHEAVRAGDAKCVAALLARGSVQNLDEPDWNVSGDPPLLIAATNHCLPVLTLLLENGCDSGARSPRGETALHRVILNGGPGNVLKFVGELLKYGCPPGVKEAGGGLTALHVLTRQLAHAQGSKNLHHNFDAALQTLDLLAKAGPVNAQDHQGRSALHILTSSTIFDNNHTTEIESLIETLLAAGADPSLKNDRGETPLHECLECGALNTAFLLIPHTPTGITSRYGETPLHIASRKNYADVVAKLLEHGEDPSVQDAGGNTPLHLASARGFHQTVSLLVTSPQAQLEKVNLEGLTALQVAAESGFVNAVRILLKAGADPSQTIHYCTTTLQRYPDISVLIDHELTRRRQLAA